jgi:hypothetical protein
VNSAGRDAGDARPPLGRSFATWIERWVGPRSRVPVPCACGRSSGSLLRRWVRTTSQRSPGIWPTTRSYLFLLSVLPVCAARRTRERPAGRPRRRAAASLPVASAQLFREQIQPDLASRIPNSWVLNVVLALGSLWAVGGLSRDYRRRERAVMKLQTLVQCGRDSVYPSCSGC